MGIGEQHDVVVMTDLLVKGFHDGQSVRIQRTVLLDCERQRRLAQRAEVGVVRDLKAVGGGASMRLFDDGGMLPLPRCTAKGGIEQVPGA